MKMQDIRCGTCSRKLGEGEYIALTIKCPRCKTMNNLRATSSALNALAHRYQEPNLSKPIIPWIGGKRRLAKHIIPQFPEHECYVEPFSGAAAIYFLKQPVKCEVLNDINGELMNLYRVVKYHPDALVAEFRWSLVSRRQFDWYQNQPIEQLTDIQRAARFYYLQKLAFGGKVVVRHLALIQQERHA
jgi:phage FluMu protein Com